MSWSVAAKGARRGNEHCDTVSVHVSALPATGQAADRPPVAVRGYPARLLRRRLYRRPGPATAVAQLHWRHRAATKAILGAARDARVARSNSKWPVYFQNLLPEGHNRERLAAQRGCSPDDEFELFDEILAVERFDRGPGGTRIHVEEFAQVLGFEPRRKYGRNLQDDYAAMLRILDSLSANPAQDVQEFIRRFIAFILMGNTDAHLKNWALIYRDGIHPELAPLYQ